MSVILQGFPSRTKTLKPYKELACCCVQGTNLKMGPLNYLFMHTVEAGAYCLGVFDNGQSGTLLGGITFRNILVEVSVQKRLSKSRFR